MVLGLLPTPRNPTKDMKDLLARLAMMRFAGYELGYGIGVWTNMEYSPGTLKVTKTIGPKVTELELILDADYTVDKVIESVQGAQFQWSQENMDNHELELLDYLLNDPRHVLTHASNVQEIVPNLYRMQVTGPINRKVQSLGITIYAEIHMSGNDIDGMDIKKRYDSGIEELVRGVYFY